MAASFELLPQHMEAENHSAVMMTLAEIAAVLLSRQFPQRILHQFLVGAGEVIPIATVGVAHLGGKQHALEGSPLVLKFRYMLGEKLVAMARAIHGLLANAVARDVVPEIDHVG